MSAAKGTFEKQARVTGGSPAEREAAKKFEQIEKTLRQDILDGRTALSGIDFNLQVDDFDLKKSRYRVLASYRRLHEICAAPDINAKIEIVSRRYSGRLWSHYFSTLVITFNQPYADSPFKFNDLLPPASPLQGAKPAMAYTIHKLPDNELENLLLYVKEERSDIFSKVAGRSPAALNRPMPVPLKLVPVKRDVGA